MQRVLKKNQKFDFGRVINISKKVNMDDFVHDPNYCAEYVNRPYTLTEWLKQFGFSQLDEEAIKSFFSECISFPSGYYWDIAVYHPSNRIIITAGYFNKRKEVIEEDRCITIEFNNLDKPEIDIPQYYPTFVKWANVVKNKVNDLVDTFYIASMKDSSNEAK